MQARKRFGGTWGFSCLVRWAAGVVALGAGISPAVAQLGVPISAPALLNTNGSPSAWDKFPQVTTDASGNWVVVWHSKDHVGGTIGTDYDILVSRSTDNGATWTPLAALNTNAGSDSGGDLYPQVTTDGAGNWVAVWDSTDDLGGTIGTDGDILVSRSTDNGATWTPPVALNTNAASDSGDDQSPQVTTDGAGNWVVVWRSHDDLGGTIGIDSDILVSRSTDSGATWTPPAALNTNASSDNGADGLPQVTTDGAGNWVAVWMSSEDLGGTIGADMDILVSCTTDSGVTWIPPTALNTNAGWDSGMNRAPQVTTDTGGNWVTVWESYDDLGGTIGTDGDILVSRSTDNGATWTALATLNANAGSDSGHDFNAQVTTDTVGNWVAVWQSYDSLSGTIGMDMDSLVSRSTDNGASWTPPAALNTNAASDSGGDYYPQVMTDRAGNWVAVWESYDDLGGTIGTDGDILTARFALRVCSGGGIGDDADLDGDGDVDPIDFLTFATCFNGSLHPPQPVCGNLCADLDADGDTDIHDFLTWVSCFNGSLNPPGCP